MIGIAIGNGGGDAQGSQRGLEYDTMSPRYAEFVEKDVLPQVEKRFNVRLTKDPEASATMGCSSGASAALSMAWYRTDLYHRVLSYSGTFVNQQWPCNPETPRRRLGLSHAHPAGTARASRSASGCTSATATSQPEHHARRHARLGRGQRADGRGPRRQGLSLPVRVRENAAHCDRAVKAQTLPAGARVALERKVKRGKGRKGRKDRIEGERAKEEQGESDRRPACASLGVVAPMGSARRVLLEQSFGILGASAGVFGGGTQARGSCPERISGRRCVQELQLARAAGKHNLR